MNDVGFIPKQPGSPFAIVGQPAKDPVCGMTVDPARAAGSHQYEGKTWYFCSLHCLEKFRADPARFTGESRPPSPAPPAAAAGTDYTCPMHPEVARNGPGACPICGMALEPKTVSLDQQENPELIDMQRRLWTSAILTAPILFMAMAEMIAGPRGDHVYAGRFAVWVQFALATPVVLWGGWPFFERAWASVLHRSPNMFTLIAMGTGTAYLYSVVAVIFPRFFRIRFAGMAVKWRSILNPPR